MTDWRNPKEVEQWKDMFAKGYMAEMEQDFRLGPTLREWRLDAYTDGIICAQGMRKVIKC